MSARPEMQRWTFRIVSPVGASQELRSNQISKDGTGARTALALVLRLRFSQDLGCFGPESLYAGIICQVYLPGRFNGVCIVVLSIGHLPATIVDHCQNKEVVGIIPGIELNALFY